MQTDTVVSVGQSEASRAAKLAGLGQVEILVRQPEDEHRRRIKSLISNIQRESVPPLELALAIKTLIGEEGSSQQQVAEQLGKSKAWVSGVLRILDLSDGAREKVWCTKLSLSADALSTIARVEDPELQSQLVDGLLAGKTQGEIRERIRLADREERPKPGPKAKRTFHTRHDAVVTVQSATSGLADDQLIAALQEALEDARALEKQNEAGLDNGDRLVQIDSRAVSCFSSELDK